MSESLESMQSRLAAYDRAASEQADAQALQSAIASSGVTLRPGVEAQAAALLRGDIRRGILDGQSVVCGPGGVPLAQHVAAKLASEEFQHFRQEAPAAPAPAPRPTSPLGQISQGLRSYLGAPVPGLEPVAPGQSLGSQMVQRATAQRAAAPDPTKDITQPMGLKPRR